MLLLVSRAHRAPEGMTGSAAGYDLTERHEMASMLGHGTRNRPLLGFVKRHRSEDPKIQQELNIALGYHVRAGNERGVNLCLWAEPSLTRRCRIPRSASLRILIRRSTAVRKPALPGVG
jgi:hypothetical protein